MPAAWPVGTDRIRDTDLSSALFPLYFLPSLSLCYCPGGNTGRSRKPASCLVWEEDPQFPENTERKKGPPALIREWNQRWDRWGEAKGGLRTLEPKGLPPPLLPARRGLVHVRPGCPSGRCPHLCPTLGSGLGQWPHWLCTLTSAGFLNNRTIWFECLLLSGGHTGELGFPIV